MTTKTSSSTFVGSLLLALTACGGASGPAIGGGNDAGGGATEDAADASGSIDAPAQEDAAVDCQALSTQLNVLQTKAQACCAQCDIVQCTSPVDGLCCPISVSSPNSPATQSFEAALRAYKKACPSACPAIACEMAPSGVCDPSGECR